MANIIQKIYNYFRIHIKIKLTTNFTLKLNLINSYIQFPMIM